MVIMQWTSWKRI